MKPETFSACFDRLIRAAKLHAQAFTLPRTAKRRIANERIQRMERHRTAIIATVSTREQVAVVSRNTDL